MPSLQEDIDRLTKSESDLESRVAAHEQKDADTVATLTAQIAALKGAGVSDVQLQALSDLADKIDKFDATAPPA